MRDCSEVEQLLAAGRDVLLSDVLPEVPVRLRHEVLMIANALAIAARSVAAGNTPLLRELSALHTLYALGDPPPISGTELDTCLRDLNRRLADDIRAGRFDGQDFERAAGQRLSEAGVHHKMRENMPKFVKQHDDGGRT